MPSPPNCGRSGCRTWNPCRSIRRSDPEIENPCLTAFSYSVQERAVRWTQRVVSHRNPPDDLKTSLFAIPYLHAFSVCSGGIFFIACFNRSMIVYLSGLL